MEAITSPTTQEILNHHLSAFLQADVHEILKDYTEESELLTPDGPMKGLDAISSFFEEAFKLVPKESSLVPKQMIVRDNVGYVAWSGETPTVQIPLGTDTFVIENDKILYHTLAVHMLPK
jgi:hypothetical protein